MEEDHADPSTTSIQLKWPRNLDKIALEKKGKAKNTSVNLIMLREIDLLDISKMIWEVVEDVLEGFSME